MYFERLGVEYIPKEIKKFRGNKNITINTYRVDASDSIMCRYFCIGFIDFILEGNLIWLESKMVLASVITGCVSNSVFASLIGIPLGITSSAVGLKICVITAAFKV